jgi:uncharacterized protein involved in outer membrane biogenesis
MKKAVIWTGAAGIALLAILAAAVIAFAYFDWNRARPWLNERVSGALGRPFAVGGDLSVEWRRHSDPQAGWRGWIPWPELAAKDVRIGNPAGFPASGDMAAIGKVMFSMNPLPLLQKKIVVSALVLEGATLDLERSATGANNWTFAAAGPQAWQFELDSLVLNKATVHLKDAVRHADVTLHADTLAGQDAAGYAIKWSLAGTFEKEPVSGTGRAGGVLSLRTQLKPYPIDADVHVGKTSIQFTGTLTKPSDLAALDMRLRLSGVSMAQLFPLLGVPLPETPAYATDGHLTAVLDKSGGIWTYEKFTGKVGASDLAGTLEFRSTQPRPTLKGEAVSNLLNFADLAPAVGGARGHRRPARRQGPARGAVQDRPLAHGGCRREVQRPAHRARQVPADRQPHHPGPRGRRRADPAAARLRRCRRNPEVERAARRARPGRQGDPGALGARPEPEAAVPDDPLHAGKPRHGPR